MNTKWRFCKSTNFTVFAASFKDVLMGCKDAVSPKLLLINWIISCLTYEENIGQLYKDDLCLFCSLALHWQRNHRLKKKETSEISNFLLTRMGKFIPSQFQGNHMNDMPVVKDLLLLSILLSDTDVVDGIIIGKLAIQNVQRYVKTVRQLRYNIHICYVSNNKAVFQTLCCPNFDTFFNGTFFLDQHSTPCSVPV